MGPSMSDEDTLDRRQYLTLAGSAAASAAIAGCSGGNGGGEGTTTGGGGGGETTAAETTSLPEPKSREGYLQRANRVAHNQAPWLYLNRQYSVYGKSTRIQWNARRDERIDAYGITPKSGGNKVTITQSQMDSGLDPHDHRETPTDNIVLQSYEGLLSRTPKGKIQNQLATKYERVEKGRVRFTIREGVTFHNGDSLTPEDVAFSINRIVKEDVGGLVSPQSDQLAGVKGAEVVDGERAVDVLSDGVNPIVFQLFATYCDIVQKKWIQNHDKSHINRNVNGTGPFKLKNYQQGVKVVFSRYEDYWKEPAAVSELTMNAASESSTRVNRLVQGEADITVNVPPQEVNRVRSNKNTELSAVPSTRVIFAAMRYDVEPFSSPKFRRAMNYAIDLQSIVKNVLQTFGDATSQPTLDGFVGYNSDLDPYPKDKAKAEQLVEESGHAGVSITLHTPVGRYLKDVEIAQAAAEQINNLSNVNCQVKQRDFQSMVKEVTTGKIKDKPHFYLLGWGNATFDASQTLIPMLTSDGAMTTWKNDEFDRLLKKAQSMTGSKGQ